VAKYFIASLIIFVKKVFIKIALALLDIQGRNFVKNFVKKLGHFDLAPFFVFVWKLDDGSMKPCSTCKNDSTRLSTFFDLFLHKWDFEQNSTSEIAQFLLVIFKFVSQIYKITTDFIFIELVLAISFNLHIQYLKQWPIINSA